MDDREKQEKGPQPGESSEAVPASLEDEDVGGEAEEEVEPPSYITCDGCGKTILLDEANDNGLELLCDDCA